MADDSFRKWARALVDATAEQLAQEIPGARLGSRSKLASGYEAVYVHFTDDQARQALCVWVYSTLAQGSNNFPGHGDIVGIGLKHNADEELDPGAWRFRLQGSRFRWRKHCDPRYEGFRLVEAADALRELPVADSAPKLAGIVLQQLRRANVVQRLSG